MGRLKAELHTVNFGLAPSVLPDQKLTIILGRIGLTSILDRTSPIASAHASVELFQHSDRRKSQARVFSKAGARSFIN